MKSERRHELQHNELAEWIIKTAKAVQPYQNLILGVVVIALVALVGYKWWSRTTAEQAAQAWDDVNGGLEVALNGGSLDKLAKASEEYPDTTAGRTAAVILADIRLAGGCNQRFVSKAPAEQELTRAIDLYESDLKQNEASFLLDRATFGLARAKESKGELESARQRYEEVVKRWPNGAYATVARQRLNDLGRIETKQMYDALAHFDPRPAYTGMPDLGPGELPGLPPDLEPNTLPGNPPVGPPGTTPGAKPNNALLDDRPAGAKKPMDNKKPADSVKPAGDKNAAEKKTGK